MKNFKEIRNEQLMNATSNKDSDSVEEMMTTADVSLPPTAMNFKNKRKTSVLTRNYIEVMGKRKKREK